jgi:hypothetical protein
VRSLAGLPGAGRHRARCHRRNPRWAQTFRRFCEFGIGTVFIGHYLRLPDDGELLSVIRHILDPLREIFQNASTNGSRRPVRFPAAA